MSRLFSGVPMMVGGGKALHDERLMRHLIADFHYGNEGVARSGDLAILAQPAPDGTVRMGPGGVAVLARHLGANGREMYYDYNDADITIPIERTGSSGGRSDLIVAMVKDPYAAGTQYQVPDSPENGPYLVPEVIPNVDRRLFTVQQLTDRVRSAVTCSMVTQPANNTVITPAMIRPLHPIANGPQRYQEPDPPPAPPEPIYDENPWTESRIHPTSAGTETVSSTSFVDWPSSARWRVPIPVWANGVDMLAIVQNPKQHVSDCTGEVRMGLDNWFGTASAFDLPACSADRHNRLPVFYSTTFRWSRSSGYPGSLRTFRVQARRTGSSPGRMTAEPGTVVFCQLSFKVCPIIN